jgi:hypothetical protein
MSFIPPWWVFLIDIGAAVLARIVWRKFKKRKKAE